MYQPVYLSTYLSIYLCIYLSAYRFNQCIYVSIYLDISNNTNLSILTVQTTHPGVTEGRQEPAMLEEIECKDLPVCLYGGIN